MGAVQRTTARSPALDGCMCTKPRGTAMVVENTSVAGVGLPETTGYCGGAVAVFCQAGKPK